MRPILESAGHGIKPPSEADFLGKRGTEIFPVASWLLPRRARKDILAFYRFARGADDIADDPSLPAKDRLARLQWLDALLHRNNPSTTTPPSWTREYALLLQEGKLSQEHGSRLLTAFMLDCVKTRYEDWEDLMAYCHFSAAPVGHAVLEACGERRANLESADALCAVLQVLNHLRDMGQDYKEQNRVYLAQSWMKEHKATEDMLSEPHLNAALRHVLNRHLDACDVLLDNAEKLFISLDHASLKAECRMMMLLAKQLSGRLRQEDPLSRRVQPGWGDFLRAAWQCWRAA